MTAQPKVQVRAVGMLAASLFRHGEGVDGHTEEGEGFKG
tara:strand:+ start:2933 stop:3049 length:117 start_codon:yes stop_codon:yes gene_type:complete